ncbi:MAG: hypothetical protein CVT88_01850 [Candidatus Altiarchaeales archaeon HGW-Altiarchaeales-1]|nr:MAG: hypothetical protein CVT88_01850 [Candidatus Altiarchaeales archaeon HGW-Altiarchaeales-1]
MTINEKEKKDKTEEKFINICPKCHSENTSPDFSNTAGINFGALNSWRCMRCGYVADISLFPEVPESESKKLPLIDLADIKKDYPLVDTSIGKFFAKLGKFFGPLGLLLCLFISITSPFLAYLLFLPIFVYIILYSYSEKCRKSQRFRNIGFFIFLYWVVLMFLYFI